MRSRLLIATPCITALLTSACIDAPTTPTGGRVIWQLAGSGTSIAPAYDQSTVYFGGFNHEMIAVEKSNGRLRWRTATGATGGLGPSTQGFNVVRAGSIAAMGDIDVYAFDAATGALKWMFRPQNGTEPGMGRLATDGTTIYAAAPDGEVFALDAQTGALRWSTQMPGDSTSAYDPVVAAGMIYVGVKRFTYPPQTGALVAINSATGAIHWVHEFLPDTVGQYSGSFGGALYHGTVITSIEDGRVFALDTATGATIWVAPRVHELPPVGGWNDLRAVAVAGAVVVVGSQTGIIVGLDAATATERWRNAPVNEISVLGAIATDDSTAYMNFTADLVAFNARNGVVLWQTGLVAGVGGEYWPTAAIDGDRLYVDGVHGFYALRR